MDRPTFSQSWSRVSRLTPTIRPHVQIERQLFRGEPWHVVHDPVSNSFFRLNPVAYHFVGLLDGRRSVDDAWRLTLDRFGDSAPTQNEVIGLLGQLNEANLLRVDLPADAEPLLKRNLQRRLRWWGGQAMSLLFMRIPIFNPDRAISWLYPIVRPLLTKWGMMLWAGWVLFCFVQLMQYFPELFRDVYSVLDPNNWGWMLLIFLGTKAIHEFGHGLVCKRFGGVVPEMGIMLLVLFPAPYVDATSAWALPSKWKRLLVGAAGMIFELAIAGIAALVWIATRQDAGLVHQLSYNLLFLASVSTVLFNANPLLRFDGYYMLSDMIEVPNLYQRGTNQLKYMIKYYVYGLDNTPPVSSSLKEQINLTLYGIAALIYRFLILFGIIVFIAGKLFTLGLLLALWSAIAWGLVPAGKFVHWLATHPSLYEHRWRASLSSAAAAAALVGLLGAVPVKDHRRALGVVESHKQANVAMQTDGFVKQVLVSSGQHIDAGDVILIADNPDLRARRADLAGELAGLEIALKKAIAEDPVNQKAVKNRIDTIREALDEADRRIVDLTLRSPQTGTLIGPNLKQLVGQFLRRGQVPVRVADLEDLRVTALVDQAHSASAFFDDIEQVEIRPAGRLAKPLASDLIRTLEAGRSTLPHPALGYKGGGSIPTDPTDPDGLKTLRPQFEMWLKLPRKTDANGQIDAAAMPVALPGERVYVRFTLATRRPLLVQWLHRLRQVLRDRLQL